MSFFQTKYFDPWQFQAVHDNKECPAVLVIHVKYQRQETSYETSFLWKA